MAEKMITISRNGFREIFRILQKVNETTYFCETKSGNTKFFIYDNFLVGAIEEEGSHKVTPCMICSISA